MPRKSFVSRRRSPDFSPCSSSQDHTLNYGTRPETLPDSKSPPEKGEYVSTVSRRISGFRGNSRTVISPIISPDPDFKPTISRTRLSTLNHRGKHRDRKGPDKPITHPSQRNKPRTKPRQKHPSEKNSGRLLKNSRNTRVVAALGSSTILSIVFYQHYNSPRPHAPSQIQAT